MLVIFRSLINREQINKNDVRNLGVNELEQSSALIMKEKLVIISESVAIILGTKFHEKLAIQEGGWDAAAFRLL